MKESDNINGNKLTVRYHQLGEDGVSVSNPVDVVTRD
jgi:hypothetical protein